jgi:glc operon protein GlcG
MKARICLRAALLVLLAMPQVMTAAQGQPQPSQGQTAPVQAPDRGQAPAQPGTPGRGAGRGGRGPQAPPLQFTLADAKVAGDAAEAAMRANNWRMIVVITDPQGVPVYLSRGDGVGAQFYNFAMGKVRAVVATGLTSKDYADGLRAGTIQAVPDAVNLEGAFPIKKNGQIVGIISASGSRADQDAVVSSAGLAAFPGADK